jgi:signal transduction histidine kinase
MRERWAWATFTAMPLPDRRRGVTQVPTPDVVLGGALAVFALINVLGSARPAAERAGLVLTALAITLPPIWRRRRALAAALVMALAMGLQAVATEPPEAIWTLVAVIVAAYSVAAYERTARALIGASAIAMAVAVSILRDPSDSGSNIAPTLLVFVVVPWLAGRTLHRRERHSERLSEQVQALEREQELLAQQAVAEERARLARELHDVVAHSLSVIAIQADAAEGALDHDYSLAREPLSAVKHTAREALGEMRRLLGLLRATDDSPQLDPQPGLARLDALVEKVGAAGLEVELSVEGERVPLAPGIDLSAYRIIQEGLTNALKHAGPTRARVSLRYTPDGVELEVVDDGPSDGAALSPAQGGHGLVGMRERVALYGGCLEAGRHPGGGYRVRATLPR